jgi:hypothetical protein
MNTKFLAGIVLLAGLAARATAQSDTSLTSTVAGIGPGEPATGGHIDTGLDFGRGDYGGYGGGNRLWLTTEYLHWKVKDAPVPFPLLTTGTTGTGALGLPDTRVLYGGSDVNLGWSNGMRATAGIWCNPDCTFGIEVSGFLLGKGGSDFSAASDPTGRPLLARPFVGPTGAAAVLPIATPDIRAGSFFASNSSRLFGTEINFNKALGRSDACGFNLLCGFRYLNLREQLDLASRSDTFPVTTTIVDAETESTTTTTTPGSTLSLADSIQTRNHIYAPQIGARYTLNCGVFSLGLTGKVGLGWNSQDVDITGRGLLAPGSISETTFVVVPEVGATLGVNLWSWMTVTAGYNFLYVNRVARPGDQFNGTLAAPTSVHESDFYVHGLTAGVILRW